MALASRIFFIDVSPSLDIATTDGIIVPVGTTAQRPGSPDEGLFRYNSTDRTFEGYSFNEGTNAVEWGPIAGAGGGTSCNGTMTFNGTTMTYTKDLANDQVVLQIDGPDGNETITLPLNDFQF